MGLKLGDILNGNVKDIKKFFAFIDLGSGLIGKLHISEVSNDYVNDISDYIKEGQSVKVKILEIDDKNQIKVSIKKANENREREDYRGRFANSMNIRSNSKRKIVANDFESMMSKFKQTSEEKLSGIKKISTNRRTGYSRKNEHKKEYDF